MVRIKKIKLWKRDRQRWSSYRKVNYLRVYFLGLFIDVPLQVI